MRLALIFVLLLYGTAFAQDVAVKDVQWDEENSSLTYNLAKESTVKIRAGVYAGPVYRTLVNLEQRKAGQNQEHWDGKDREGKIDFLKYAKIHFCVDLPVREVADSSLEAQILEGSHKIKIDLQDDLKELYLKNGAELKVYFDNKLINLEKVGSLPYAFELNLPEATAGKHLLVINLWEMLNLSSVACQSFEINIALDSSRKEKEVKIALCQKDKQGFWQVFTKPGNKNPKQLTFSRVDKRYPNWSPDGKMIAYVNNKGELWLMDESGRDKHKLELPVSCSEPKFSPDGIKIIFTSLDDVYHGNTKIWSVDLETSELKKLVNRPWQQYNPSYSPDQKYVIFTDGPELFGQNILKLDLKKGDITQITDNSAYDYDMQACPLNTGQEIVYSTNEEGDYEIFKIDKFGRNKVNLTKAPDYYDIMPTAPNVGDRIYFLSDRTGELELWQMNNDGSEPEQVTRSNSGINSYSVLAQ